MANVDILLGDKSLAWFTANPTLVLKKGQIVFLEGQSGTYKKGDNVTQLSALSFLGGNSYTLTDAEIGSVINGAASATPNDTDLVISVESSVAKKNTWTQIKAFLKTYFDTLFVKKGTITNNTLLKGSSTDTATNSSITDDGTNVTRDGSGHTYLKAGTLDKGEMYLDEEYAGFNTLNKSISLDETTQFYPKYIQIKNSENKIVHDLKNTFDAPANNFPQLTASQIVETDASKNLVSVAKATGYNLALGTSAGTVLEGDKGLLIANNLSDLNNPLTARNNLKEWDLYLTGGDQSTTSNVASNITGLVTPTLDANKVYAFDIFMRVGCSASGGVKFQLTTPTGSSFVAVIDGVTSTNSSRNAQIISASATLTSLAFITVAGVSFVRINGTLSNGSNVGTLQLGFASATNTQTSTIYSLGTYMFVKQLN